MKYLDMFENVKKLKFDKELVVCKENGVELFILRPSKLSKRFKTYDIEKNFQIWLREGSRVFRPNHLRVIIDLHLRSRSNSKLKTKLLTVFDNIFYGNDPEQEAQSLKNADFKHFLNPLPIIASLSQLFLIEQAYGYNKESHFDPPTLFYQGWVRQAVDDTREIDNMCMSIANRQPPPAKYTAKENKKNRNFTEDLKPLWYVDGS